MKKIALLFASASLLATGVVRAEEPVALTKG